MRETDPLVLIGQSIRDHRVQQGITQERLAYLSGMSMSKLSRIENGKYPHLTLEHFYYLVHDLNLRSTVRLCKKEVSVGGKFEYHSDAAGSRCFGTGFVIAWQSGSLITQADQNGARLEDVIMACLTRADELDKAAGGSQRTQAAIGYLSRALVALQNNS